MDAPGAPTAPALRPGRGEVRPAEPAARLRGPWLLLARLSWLAVTLLAAGLFVASFPAGWASA